MVDMEDEIEYEEVDAPAREAASLLGPGEPRRFVATKEDRQAFFTHVMYNGEVPWRERIRSAELLGKSEGDFVERVDIDARVGGVMFGVVMDPAERAKLMQTLMPSLCGGSSDSGDDEDEE